MRDRIARSVFWMVWSRGGIQLLSFIGTILVARELNPNDYGLMALVGIWTVTMQLIAEMGLGGAIVQFRDLNDKELNLCFWFTMILAGVGYCGVYIAAPPIADWFNSPGLSQLLRVGGLSLPLAAVRLVPDSLLRKQLALDKISQAEAVASLATIPVMVVMAWNGFGVWALILGSILLQLVQSVSTFWFLNWQPGLRIGSRRLGRILRFSFASFGSRLCWSLYQQADAFVLGKVSGELTLGFYAMAKQLAILPVTKISGFVNQLAFPLMAELQTNREAMRASWLRGFRIVATVALPASIGLILVAEDLIRVALTEKWISSVPILQLLCVYASLKSLDALLPAVLSAQYRMKFLFAYTLTLLGIMPIAFWIGAQWWNAIGVAIAWVVVYPVILSWMAREALHEMNLSWKTLSGQLWRPVTATIVMTGLVLVAGSVASTLLWMTAMDRLVLMCLVGVISYVVTLFVIAKSLREEILEVTGWVLGKGLPQRRVSEVNP